MHAKMMPLMMQEGKNRLGISFPLVLSFCRLWMVVSVVHTGNGDVCMLLLCVVCRVLCAVVDLSSFSFFESRT